ncbi:DUF1236 domain-containing protein [Microvirga brassicacearum]|uniref:DUF1236 domain-containing protein n=1 Tax=Microvirga brassicacearum TaxID=2580413 RepID=A0A5N3PB59_9HYPH|nr:DUF1236 domain-containing protein [Microvirga brassicacearum]KAB0266977.1 DUF1236 domain-containing protein [Microvirga brassicacearum]
MRMTLLTTAAVAALSLSFAAVAQTSGTPGTSGGTTVNPGAGASPSGPAGGPASGQMNRPPSDGSGASAPPRATGSGAPGTASGGAQGAPGAAPTTTGSTTGSPSTAVSVSSEQRTEITRAFSGVNVQPLTNVEFNVSVGASVPASVTTLYDCPNTVERILTGLPECKYVVIRDQIVIVEPSTRRIVTVIERRG